MTQDEMRWLFPRYKTMEKLMEREAFIREAAENVGVLDPFTLTILIDVIGAVISNVVTLCFRKLHKDTDFHNLKKGQKNILRLAIRFEMGKKLPIEYRQRIFNAITTTACKHSNQEIGAFFQ